MSQHTPSKSEDQSSSSGRAFSDLDSLTWLDRDEPPPMSRVPSGTPPLQQEKQGKEAACGSLAAVVCCSAESRYRSKRKPDLTKSDKRVLHFISQNQNRELSFSFIAKGLNLSERAVKSAKKKLQATNLLICHRGKKLAPDVNRPNRYELTEKGRASVVKNFTPPPGQNLHTSLLTENKHESAGGVSSGVQTERPVRHDAVGSKEVRDKQKGVRGEKRAQRKPPDPRFEQILARYNSRKTWPDEVEPAGKRGLERLLWFQPNLTAEEIIRRLDNAFASDGYPFYGRAFSLKDFCAHHLKFRDGPSKCPRRSTSNPNLQKKSVAQLVAERGGSWIEQRERVMREGKTWRKEYFNRTIDDVEAFCEVTGWNYRNADPQEICFGFLEEISSVWGDPENMRKEHAKENSPGILMCMVIDSCIDKRRREGEPVIPIPRSFFERKDELRRMERKLAEA